ncbi:hypothetical protein [Geminicoccus flavidas]|uniref:hypothetical protein n=1 Tax=Geminicoccus flavidas TaxID=2506407 RepID=UPI001357C874|nr:hypothetical protein [Geminicoccus flavidas]
MKTDPSANIYDPIRATPNRWFEESGLSLNKWRKLAGVSQNYPIQVLDDTIATPALDKLQMLCSDLNKTLRDLLKEAKRR